MANQQGGDKRPEDAARQDPAEELPPAPTANGGPGIVTGPQPGGPPPGGGLGAGLGAGGASEDGAGSGSVER